MARRSMAAVTVAETRALHVHTSAYGGWVVRRYLRTRALRRFKYKAEAIAWARKIRREGKYPNAWGRTVTGIFLHRVDGTVSRVI